MKQYKKNYNSKQNKAIGYYSIPLNSISVKKERFFSLTNDRLKAVKSHYKWGML